MANENGFSAAYPIEFLARNPIMLDEPALRAAFTKRLGRVKAAEKAKADGFQLYFLQDYPVEFKDGSIPAQLLLFWADEGKPLERRPEVVEQSLQQSWSFRGSRELYQECGHNFVLANMISSPLPHHMRREIIANGLMAILETTQVDLIHWSPSQQMLSPADIHNRYADPEELANPVFGFLNVRFFNIANSSGDMLMDTIGLNALGLTDFQIHYHELDPDPIARFLYNLGAYAFEKGDVIEDGHTVEGPNKSRWICQREMSLLEPQREVLDINPGPEFAAGNRA